MNYVQIISFFIKSSTEKQQISWLQPQFSNDHRPIAFSFEPSAVAARPPRARRMKFRLVGTVKRLNVEHRTSNVQY
jgi:hypothetical protein